MEHQNNPEEEQEIKTDLEIEIESSSNNEFLNMKRERDKPLFKVYKNKDLKAQKEKQQKKELKATMKEIKRIEREEKKQQKEQEKRLLKLKKEEQKELQDLLKEEYNLNPFTFSQKDFNLLTQKSCTICLEDFTIDKTYIYTPCYHLFHEDCIKKWLEKSRKCPMCNTQIKIKENNYSNMQNEQHFRNTNPFVSDHDYIYFYRPNHNFNRIQSINDSRNVIARLLSSLDFSDGF